MHYEVHFARANRADQIASLRRGATRHDTREAALAEASRIVPPRPDLVTLVVEVRREV